MHGHVSIWLMLQPASEENVFEDLQQCHRLMLRDSPCLFQWQSCNDFRRQTDWRQDPLDYFVSDIKRPRYTQWKDQGQEQWVLPHLIDITIKREWKALLHLVKVRRAQGGEELCSGMVRSWHFVGVFEVACIYCETKEYLTRSFSSLFDTCLCNTWESAKSLQLFLDKLLCGLLFSDKVSVLSRWWLNLFTVGLLRFQKVKKCFNYHAPKRGKLWLWFELNQAIHHSEHS